MNEATYGDLEEALFTLGFTATTGVGEYGAHYTRYDNTPCDAWIILASAPKDKRLSPGDLLVAEKTVVGRGVAETATFRELLNKQAANVQAQAS